MLSRSEVHEIVASIQYKPGWTFAVLDRSVSGLTGMKDGYVLAIQALCFDSRKTLPVVEQADPFHPRISGNVIQIHKQSSFVAGFYSKKDVLGWVKNEITELEQHEIDEFFKFQGVLVHDPH